MRRKFLTDASWAPTSAEAQLPLAQFSMDICALRGLGFRVLGVRVLGFRGLGFRGLGFIGLGFRGLGVQGQGG